MSDITALVGAFDDGTSDLCYRLDEVAFQTLYAFLRISEPCLAHQRGHCLFVESLHASRAVTPAEKTSLVVRKASLGKNVLSRSIKAFLDPRRNPRARRWIGSLALELLRDCPKNQDLLSVQELAQTRQALGEAVVHDNDESLRLIAGTIIRELVESGLSAYKFWRPERFPDPPSRFEAILEHTSQWATDFVNFVDDLETQGILTQENSSTFAYAVYVAGNVYNTKTGLSILVTLSEDLTIVVPSTEADTTKYIDVPLEHVDTVQLGEGQPGSQSGLVAPLAATVLVLHLRKTTGTAYYINEVGHPPCQINLAFDSLEDARSIKEQIEATKAPQDERESEPDAGLEETSSTFLDLGRPMEMLSQSAYLDISTRPGLKGSTSYEDANEFHIMRPESRIAPISGTHSTLTASTTSKPGLDAGSSHRETISGGRVHKASPSRVLVAIDVLDVRQEFRQDEILDHGRNRSEDTFELGLASSSGWRGGLQAIENAKELEPSRPATPANTTANIHNTEKEPHVLEDIDDDLYSATPQRSNLQSAQPTSNEFAHKSGRRQLQNAASTNPSKPSSRKLSRSMRVSENEPLSTFPSTTTRGGQSAGKGQDDVVTKLPPSVANQSGASKRKSIAIGNAGPNKKRKVSNSVTKESATDKDTLSTSHKTARSDEYDIPATPPGRQLAKLKPRVSARDKPALVKDRSEKKVPTKISKLADTKYPAIKNAAKAKGPKSAKTAEPKETYTLAETDWDQDLVVDANNNTDVGMDKKGIKSNQKQPRNGNLKATSKGKITKRSQPTKTNAKNKTTKTKQSVPNRSPRKPRAAKQTANRRILAMGDDDTEGQGVSSQQGLSSETGITTEAPQAAGRNDPENSPGNVDEAIDTLEVHLSRKKQRNLSIEDSARRDGNQNSVSSPHAASGKPESPPEGLILNTQPAITQPGDRQARQLEQLEESTGHPATLVEQLIEQEGAPSDLCADVPAIPLGENAERAQQDSHSFKENNKVSDASKPDPETRNITSNLPNLDVLENDGMQYDIEGTHFDDAMAPLMLEAIDHAAERDIEVDRGPEDSAELALAGDETSAATIPVESANLTERKHTSQKVIVTDQKVGQEGTATRSQYTPENPPQEKKETSVQPPITHAPVETFAANNASKSHDQGLHTTEPVAGIEGTVQSKHAHGGISVTSPRPRNGRGVVGDENECSTRQPETKMATKTDRATSPIPQSSGHPINAPLMRDAECKGQESRASNFDAYPISNSLGFDGEPVDVPNDPPVKPQHEHCRKISASFLEESATLKRSSKPVDQYPYKKRKLSPQIPQESRLDTPPDRLRKDPTRIPQIVSFSANGPRNQGSSASAFSSKTPLALQDQGTMGSTLNSTQMPRKDIGTMTSDTLHEFPARTQRQQKAEQACIKLQDDSAELQGETLISKPAHGVIRQPRKPFRDPLLEHSSLFTGDNAPRVSSQSSRVAENGSPMPVHRTLNTRPTVKEPGKICIVPSESEGIGTPFSEEETIFMHQSDDESSEIELPQVAAPGATRKKEVGFIGSSNSKHRPSSPSAPSALLTEVQAHKLEPGGQFVNMQTDTVLVPSKPQDPFAGEKVQPSNRFLDRLRRAASNLHKQDHTAVQSPKATKKPRAVLPTATGEDPDETLVEGSKGQPGKRNQVTPTTTSISSTSPSNEQSRSSEDSNAFKAYIERWRNALEPHQENMLAVLYEISHSLVGHLMDTETAINDVVKDYQSRGERVINTLADDLERELGQHVSTADVRRGETTKQLELLNSKVSKNLQRKPKAEALTLQMQERQKVIIGQMEAALRLCGDGTD
ncbi:MAG: hypothetical protein Q9225_003302 [Loekoesia sp. 1 TL-2023]